MEINVPVIDRRGKHHVFASGKNTRSGIAIAFYKSNVRLSLNGYSKKKQEAIETSGERGWKLNTRGWMKSLIWNSTSIGFHLWRRGAGLKIELYYVQYQTNWSKFAFRTTEVCYILNWSKVSKPEAACSKNTFNIESTYRLCFRRCYESKRLFPFTWLTNGLKRHKRCRMCSW